MFRFEVKLWGGGRGRRPYHTPARRRLRSSVTDRLVVTPTNRSTLDDRDCVFSGSVGGPGTVSPRQ